MPDPIAPAACPRTPEEDPEGGTSAAGQVCAPESLACDAASSSAPPAPEPELPAGAAALVAARSSKRRESSASTTGPTTATTHESESTTASAHLYRDESSAGTLALGGARLRMSEHGPEADAAALRVKTPVTDNSEIDAQVLSGGVVATANGDGVAVGAQFNVTQWDVTWTSERGSVTAGVALGGGYAFQYRLNDSDGDGKADGVCFRAEVGAFIVGGCNPHQDSDPAAQGGSHHAGNVPDPGAGGGGGAPSQ